MQEEPSAADFRLFFMRCTIQGIFQAPLTAGLAHIHFLWQEPIHRLPAQQHQPAELGQALGPLPRVDGVGRGI